MGFDVIGPTRRGKASNVDDGSPPFYDVFYLAKQLNVSGPLLRRLNERLYASTTVSYADGSVSALRDELAALRAAYRLRREPELARERGVRACNPAVRRSILETVFQTDVVDRVLSELLLLCDEALALRQDVQCEGD